MACLLMGLVLPVRKLRKKGERVGWISLTNASSSCAPGFAL